MNLAMICIIINEKFISYNPSGLDSFELSARCYVSSRYLAHAPRYIYYGIIVLHDKSRYFVVILHCIFSNLSMNIKTSIMMNSDRSGWSFSLDYYLSGCHAASSSIPKLAIGSYWPNQRHSDTSIVGALLYLSKLSVGVQKGPIHDRLTMRKPPNFSTCNLSFV